jgi:hypothetical protein
MGGGRPGLASNKQASAVLAALQELMRAGVGAGFGAGPGVGTAAPPGATISGSSTAPTVSGAAPSFRAVVAGLTALQNLPQVLEPGAAGAQGGAVGFATTSDSVEESARDPISHTIACPGGFDLRSLKDGGINRLLGDDAPVEMGSLDEMLVDIVAMMFDFILDDDDLPNAMKALIGRLQIPVLKVAILDRTLFSRRFHPARKLLNTLAEAAFGWDEVAGADDSLFRKIDELVHRVLDEYDDDIAVFSDVLFALQAFLDGEARERQERIERQAAAMTNRERLDDAKLTVKQEIRTALSGVVLPPIVKLFVTRGLGVDANVQPDISHCSARPGDLYLLFTDGLSDMVEHRQLEAVTKCYQSAPDVLVDTLIKVANENGGKDKISAVVARVNKAFPLRKRWYVRKSISGKIQFSGRTDVGRKREHNEDSIAIAAVTGALIVADGMGGYLREKSLVRWRWRRRWRIWGTALNQLSPQARMRNHAWPTPTCNWRASNLFGHQNIANAQATNPRQAV